MANVQSAEVNREQSMTQSLAQLQAEWRSYESYVHDKDFEAGEECGYHKCADALQPHVEREAAAQAKSLADERRIQELEALLAELRNPLKAIRDAITNEALRKAQDDFMPIYGRVFYRIPEAALRVETKHE